jgi:hypothetical protein
VRPRHQNRTLAHTHDACRRRANETLAPTWLAAITKHDQIRTTDFSLGYDGRVVWPFKHLEPEMARVIPEDRADE